MSSDNNDDFNFDDGDQVTQDNVEDDTGAGDDLPPLTYIDNLWSDAHLQAPFSQCDMLCRYARDHGRVQLGVSATPAAPDAPYTEQVSCEVVQLYAPRGQLSIAWTARRIGLPPVALDPLAPCSDPNVVLAEDVYELQSPTLDTDGLTHWYRASGFYRYFLLQPLSVVDGLKMGVLPLDTTPAADNVFGLESISQSFF